MRLGNFIAFMATLDLCLAVHRGPTNGTHQCMLYTIHRDKSLHHIRYRNCCILCACHCDDHSLLAHMEGNQEAAKRSSVLASWKTRCQ